MIIPALSEALAAAAVPALATNVELTAPAFAPLFAALEEGGGAEVVARPAPRASGADSLAGAAATALASPVRAVPLPGASTDAKAPIRSGPGVTAPALATNVELLAADFPPLFAPVEEGGRPKVAARPALRAADVGQSLAGTAALALTALASPAGEVPLPAATMNAKAPTHTGPGAAAPALEPRPTSTAPAKEPRHAASADATVAPAAPMADHTGPTAPVTDAPVSSETPDVAPVDEAVIIQHAASTAAAKTLARPVTGENAPEDAREEPDVERSVVAARVAPLARAAAPRPNEAPPVATLTLGDATGATDPRGREPARRATDAVTPDRSAGADRSAANPLPPATDAPPRAEAAAPRDLPPHAAPTHDLDRLARLAELRPAPRDELRLELSPDGLGPIEVRVAVRADGVHASLFAQHDQARDALAQHRPLLETALQRSHLRLEGFTVDLGGRHHGAAADAHEPLPAIPPLPMTPTEDPLPAPASGLSVRA